MEFYFVCFCKWMISLLQDPNDEDAFIKLLVDEAVNSKAIEYVEEWLQ